MSDNYSTHDPMRQTHRGAMDYGSGGSASWIWALIILVALVALIAIGSSGPASEGSGEAIAPPAAPAATTTIEN